jgi:UDP-N-acetylmuramoyl-tripeptide--D-alanyl-D-alanine ligase|tara:strand:- start:10363 stop:11697 length:1335 start_codon:yes stop_codon:yes gene_type:complete
MRIDLPNPDKFKHIFDMTLDEPLSEKVNGISTDSRDIKEGDLYLAISGEKVDGHSFLEEVFAKGARTALVSQSIDNFKGKLIKLDDPVYAIGEIAKTWRDQFQIPVIGITGSNGKTSTKELLKYILSAKYDIHATEGNYNTSIGLPLTLLRLTEYHGVSILEMGANQPGDIEKLCKIARPTHGLITNIAPAHLEGFGDIQTVANTKGELFKYLSSGLSFINAADNRINDLETYGDSITFGLTSNCDYPTDLHHNNDGSIILTIDAEEIKTNSKNLSFAKNVIACSTIASELGLSWEAIKDRILTSKPPKGRCEIKTNGQITVIDDTYNANVDSTIAAIDYLKAFSGNGKRIFVFGDMLELGDSSEDQHRIIGKKCQKEELSVVFTIGNETIVAHEEINNSILHKHFEQKESLLSNLNEIISEGDKILVKGSRGMRMEKIVEQII